MDYSSANTGLWNFFVQMGIIAGVLLLSNVLARKSRMIVLRVCRGFGGNHFRGETIE